MELVFKYAIQVEGQLTDVELERLDDQLSAQSSDIREALQAAMRAAVQQTSFPSNTFDLQVSVKETL